MLIITAALKLQDKLRKVEAKRKKERTNQTE